MMIFWNIPLWCEVECGGGRPTRWWEPSVLIRCLPLVPMQRLMNRSKPPMSNSQQQSLTRWAVGVRASSAVNTWIDIGYMGMVNEAGYLCWLLRKVTGGRCAFTEKPSTRVNVCIIVTCHVVLRLSWFMFPPTQCTKNLNKICWGWRHLKTGKPTVFFNTTRNGLPAWCDL